MVFAEGVGKLNGGRAGERAGQVTACNKVQGRVWHAAVCFVVGYLTLSGSGLRTLRVRLRAALNVYGGRQWSTTAILVVVIY